MTGRNLRLKQCSKCSEYKPTSDFYKQSSAKDGLQSYCILCFKKVAKAKHDANPKYYLDRTRAWKKLNPEKVNAQNRRWAAKNPKKVLQMTRNYRAKNPETVSNHNHKRRDLKINNGNFVVTKSFIKKLYLSNCIYCGSKEKIQADHVIPLAKGGRHSEGNLVPACQKCNLDKRDKTITEWKKTKKNP